MYKSEILIPLRDMPYGGIIEIPYWQHLGISKTIQNAEDHGYRPIFAPELADARINASDNSSVFQDYVTASVQVPGRTKSSNFSVKGGTRVVIYAHVPNYFADLRNHAIEFHTFHMWESTFNELLNLEDGGSVFVVDHKKLRRSYSGLIHVRKALKHPQTIPFLGGEERAEMYLERHKELYGDYIGIFHSVDSDNGGGHDARLLAFGRLARDCSSEYHLDGGHHFATNGRMIFVKKYEQPVEPPQTLEQVLDKS